ncbi:septum site-determining protein Ssd [Microlunatus spumicola]|uniref:septum site-determining protein Ssd n=1 Tax=Microlunatus spumicola TaxID=81499 RepID=UPI00195D51FB
MPRPTPPPTRPSPPPTGEGPPVLVLTADPVLARHLLSVVAAVGLAPHDPVGDDDLRRSWRSASAVLVGRDRADQVNGLVLPPRPEVYVVGRDDDRVETYAWSTRLRAAVATLPSGAPDLAAALSGLADDAGRGVVVALTGGAGGVGTSTLAAALALTGARAGLRTLLVDTDPDGGGIDVLLGAEHLPGWRWSRFATARGHLGDVTAQLPHCDGVDVLAVDRGVRPELVLGPEQLAAVLGSAARENDLTVVDLPRHLDRAHDEVLRRAGRVLLLVRADVRGVAAADRAARSLATRCRVLEVVARTGPGRTLEPGLVADALDLPLAGSLPEDATVRPAAERGEPPGRSARSPLARLCGRLLDDPDGVAA